MRAIIVSDIHGRLEAAKKLEALFRSFNPDRVFYLGDYLNNGPRNGVPYDYDPLGVSEILNKWSKISLGVRGNCDSRVDQTLLHFGMNEDSKIVYFNGYRLDLIHGDLLTSELLDVERGDVLLFGHTHVYMLKSQDGVIYLNPGSVSFPKNGNPPTYATLDERKIEIHNLEDDSVVATLNLY